MMNRWAFYGLTVLSCGLLAVLFLDRDQPLMAVVIMVVASFYVIRGFISSRNEKLAHRQETVQEMAGVRSTSQKRVVLQELLDTRARLRGARQRYTLFGVLIAIAAVWTYPTSGPVALTISAMLVPLGFLIIRNSRAIHVIERGLSERGYSYQ